ncbi:hypothetical protein PVAP13_3KG485900 [Panicum virgatum]|uniref:Uncharacterized protein n=1 Tax=Panicum virgatum TaxID=38727 RepID=A0A8T0VC44_PANVG|nr:hypothetical protein PVAP13_3KG485900 [Panicum virgatum]
MKKNRILKQLLTKKYLRKQILTGKVSDEEKRKPIHLKKRRHHARIRSYFRSVSGIPCNDSQQRTTKTFYGDFAPTPSHATQNAYNEVLKYLTSENIVAINDYNYPALLETKKDLDETTARLMIADYVEPQFDMSLSCVKSGYNIILSKLDDISIKLSDVLPITVSHQSDEENNQVPFNVEYTGPADPNEPCALLAKFLVDLRKTTISLM